MKYLFRYLNILIASGILLACVSIVRGQTDEVKGPSLNSPYATMRTHLYYLQYDSYQPEFAAMTIPPGHDIMSAEKLAIQLKQILDGRGLYVRLNMIPQDPDYMDSTAQAHIYTPFPKDAPEIYLEKQDNQWYYSTETVDAIPALHRALYPLGADLLSRRMPDSLRRRFLGIALWQYLGILLLLLASWFLHILLSLVLRPVVRWVANHVRNLGYAEPTDLHKSARYISLLLIVYSVARIYPVLQLPIRFSLFVTRAIDILLALIWMLFGLVLVRIVSRRFQAITAVTDSKMDDQLLPIVRKLLQIAVVVAAIVYILGAINVNVTALIAGLSIGALALALAAQDTVKNLIGSLMIFIDKPFQVGDYVTLDGQEGTVVEVGFRTTRIQLIDTSIMAIPNGNVANISVVNLGVRKMRMMNILIGVTYSTPPEKIEAYIAELKKLILEHPMTDKENYLVYFRDMGDFALKIIFRCYIPVFTFPEELEIKEGIYLEIMRIAQRLEIDFAFPSQSIYLEK